MKKSIIKNTAFNVFYKLLNILFPLITSAYLARVLGPFYIGKVAYAQNIVSYFLAIASMGIPTYGIREVAKQVSNKKKLNKVFSELFVLNAISTFVCSFIYTTIIFFSGFFKSDLQLYVCVGLTLYMNVLNVDWFYSGNEKYAYITIRSFVIKMISLVSMVLLVKEQSDYLIYALLTSLATTGNYVLNMVNLRGRVKFQTRNLNLKQHIKPIFILLITVLATDLYNQIDVTMIGAWMSEEVVGYYSNGVKLVKTIYSITVAISATIMPRMCLLYSEKRTVEFNGLLNQVMEVVVLIAVPAAIGLMMVREPVVIILFGAEFMPTADIILLLAPIIIIISISYLVGSVVLTATINERCLLVATISGALVNIGCNCVFIPMWGMKGAVIASLVAEIVVLIIHIFYSYKYFRLLSGSKFFLSIIAGVLGMILVVIMCYKLWGESNIGYLLSALILGSISYFLTLYFTRNPVISKIKNILKK